MCRLSLVNITVNKPPYGVTYSSTKFDRTARDHDQPPEAKTSSAN